MAIKSTVYSCTFFKEINRDGSFHASEDCHSNPWRHDSIHRGKMEQILLAYGIPKETVTAIMILYRNTKVKVRFPDGDTDYFNIVAGVLQGNTLAPYLFIICLNYVLRTSIDKIKENGFELTKKRSRRYPAKIIADYADDSDFGKCTCQSQNLIA